MNKSVDEIIEIIKHNTTVDKISSGNPKIKLTNKLCIADVQYTAYWYKKGEKLSDTQVEYILWRYDSKCKEDPFASWISIIEELIDDIEGNSDQELTLKMYQ